jgi:hypothetical protein
LGAQWALGPEAWQSGVLQACHAGASLSGYLARLQSSDLVVLRGEAQRSGNTVGLCLGDLAEQWPCGSAEQGPGGSVGCSTVEWRSGRVLAVLWTRGPSDRDLAGLWSRGLDCEAGAQWSRDLAGLQCRDLATCMVEWPAK